MNRRAVTSACVVALVLIALAACSPQGAQDDAKPAATPAAIAQDDEPTCNDDPRAGEEHRLPRCSGSATVSPPRAYRVVGGGDPVDQVVCDIEQTFVLDGKLFGVELSGGIDGTYRFVRTPNIPGLSWTAAGRYHIEFPDGADQPGTLTTAGGGTTTAGSTSRATSGGERFTLTPVDACMQSTAASK